MTERLALVAGCQVFRGIFHIDRQRRLTPHIDLNLHRGSVGAADADEIDVVKAFLPDLIHNLLNLGTQSQGAIDAVDVALLVEVAQAGTLSLSPSFRFVIHTILDPFLTNRQLVNRLVWFSYPYSGKIGMRTESLCPSRAIRDPPVLPDTYVHSRLFPPHAAAGPHSPAFQWHCEQSAGLRHTHPPTHFRRAAPYRARIPRFRFYSE